VTVTYLTVPDVELVTVGMEWPGTGGNNPDGTIALALEHLVDMMVAANNDPLIRAPRVKLGHSRLQPGEDGLTTLGDHDPFWDGAPVFGTAVDLRLTNDGAKLVGDLVEVPAWLVDAMPSAWPNRSCEWVWAVETEGGKRYSAVLTAVALLGERQHAVKDLADVRRLLEQGPDPS
jgi:hypothetical protein